MPGVYKAREAEEYVCARCGRRHLRGEACPYTQRTQDARNSQRQWSFHSTYSNGDVDIVDSPVTEVTNRHSKNPCCYRIIQAGESGSEQPERNRKDRQRNQIDSLRGEILPNSISLPCHFSTKHEQDGTDEQCENYVARHRGIVGIESYEEWKRSEWEPWKSKRQCWELLDDPIAFLRTEFASPKWYLLRHAGIKQASSSYRLE